MTLTLALQLKKLIPVLIFIENPTYGFPPNLLYNGYQFFQGGKERPGRDADSLPPSSAVVKKE
jgi:hypothetical protein